MHDPRNELRLQDAFDADLAALVRIESDFLQVVQRMTVDVMGRDRIAADDDIVYCITAPVLGFTS